MARIPFEASNAVGMWWQAKYRFANLERAATRKLQMPDGAAELRDLTAPPANRLEALKGERKGQHRIRIDDPRRVCFVWTRAGPEQVEIVDYH